MKSNYKKLRTLQDQDGLIYIQELKFGLIWWTVLKTHNHKAALAFLQFSGLEYNENTGNYE